MTWPIALRPRADRALLALFNLRMVHSLLTPAKARKCAQKQGKGPAQGDSGQLEHCKPTGFKMNALEISPFKNQTSVARYGSELFRASLGPH